MTPPKQNNRIGRRRTLLFLASVVLLTCATYYSSLSFDFILWDDDTHLINLIHSESLNPEHLKKFFTSTVHKSYIPLTSVSFAIERKLFGLDSGIHHLNNLLLHLGVIVGLFIFARRLGINSRAAAVATLIFAVHPMHVESVVWITERKDVLYSFFYVLSLIYYLSYIKGKNHFFYVMSIFFCLLSILSKPMALSLPLILFLCDWQMKRSFTARMLLDKIPYAAIIAPITWITYSLHMRVPGNNPIEGITIWIWTFVFYIRKFFFPDVLLPIYQLPQPVTLLNLSYLLSLLLFAAIFVIFLKFYANRWLRFSILFYFCSIFFLLRFDNTTDLNIVADRFMYLPSVGFCFLIGIFVDHQMTQLRSQSRFKRISYNILITIVIFLIIQMSYFQMQIWANNYAFWNNLVRHFPDNEIMRGSRAKEYMRQNNYQAAINDLHFILNKNPNNRHALNDIGISNFHIGESGKSLRYFKKCISVDEKFYDCYYNLGVLYMSQGQDKKAEDNFMITLDKNHHYYKALFQLGNIYYDRGQFERAIDYYDQAIRLKPDYHTAASNRSLALELLHP